MKSSFACLFAPALFSLTWLTGCSATNDIDYGSVDLVSVSGTVALDGQPLPGAVITFEDPANGTYSFARTDSGGNYTLQFDSQKDGVIPGKKIVQISTTRNVLGLKGEEGVEEGESSSEGEPAPKAAEEAVPACYNKESKLTVEVSSSNRTFDFDLKSDCSTTGPQ